MTGYIMWCVEATPTKSLDQKDFTEEKWCIPHRWSLSTLIYFNPFQKARETLENGEWEKAGYSCEGLLFLPALQFGPINTQQAQKG